MRFTIDGPPRTKKNSLKIIRVRGVPRVAQGDAANAWEEVAILQLRSQNRPRMTISGPVNMRAHVYRERSGRADLLNYLAAVSDALEGAGILENDEQVLGLDGSRLLIDRARPRVEIELTPLDA